jgi:hypothetical protein
VATAFIGIQHFHLMTRMFPIRGTNMQHRTRPEDAIKFLHDRVVVSQMFKNFEANNFVKSSLLLREVIQISLFKRKSSRICFAVLDEKFASLLDLSLFKVQRQHTRAASIR